MPSKPDFPKVKPRPFKFLPKRRRYDEMSTILTNHRAADQSNAMVETSVRSLVSRCSGRNLDGLSLIFQIDPHLNKHFRAVARSENPGGLVVLGRENVPPPLPG